MKKKLLTIVLVLVMLVAMTVALVACDDPEEKDKPTTVPQKDALLTILEGHGLGETGVLHVAYNVKTVVSGEEYNIAIKTNLNEKKSELFFEVKNIDNKVVIGIYIKDGRVYIDAGEGKPKLYLADFDMSNILQMLLEIDAIKELDGILSGALGMDIDGLLDMVAPILFKPAVIVTEGTKTTYTMDMDIQSLLYIVKMLATEADINKMLYDMGINIEMDLNALILGINIPGVTAKLVSVIDDGETLSTQLLVNNVETAIFDMQIAVEVAGEVVDLGFPESIKTFVPFSFTNICFDGVLNVGADGLDVASLINMITGQKTLPQGVIVFNSDKDFSFKIRTDLDVDDNNKNLIFAEIYMGKNFDQKLVGAYYKNGVLYIDFNNALPETINIPNLKIENIDITAQLKVLVDTINGIAGASAQPEQVTPVVKNVNDTTVLSPDIISFAKTVIDLIGFSDWASVTTNKIDVTINQGLLDALSSIVPSLGVTLPEFLGDIKIGINLDNEIAISSFDISVDMPGFDTKFVGNINNIQIGYINATISDRIDEATSGKTFVTDVKELLYKTIEGINIKADTTINLTAGRHNIAELFSVFGLTLPELFYDIPDGIVDEIFTIDMKMNLDRNNKDNNLISIEIIAARDNIICPKGLMLGLYHKDNTMYLDLSNITFSAFKMPIIRVDIDFASMLLNELEKLDQSILIEQAGEQVSIPQESKSVLSNVNDLIEINVDAKKLAILATSQAITNLLNSLGMDISLPSFELSADITNIDDIRIGMTSGELTIDLAIYHVTTGVKQDIVIDIDREGTYDDLGDLLFKQFGSAVIDTNIDLTTQDSKLDLTSFINGILSATNTSLNVPVVLDLLNRATTINILAKWNIDLNSYDNTEFMLEIKSLDNASIIMGLYGYNNSTYVDLPVLGAKLEIYGLNLQQILIDALNDLKNSISLNITDIINDLINGKSSSADSSNSLTNTADPIVIPPDFIEYLFQGIKIVNTSIGVDFSTELLAKMLLSVGIDLGIDATLSGSIDPDNSSLSLKGQIGGLSIDLTSQVKELGLYNELGLSADMFKTFKVLDTTSGLKLADSLFEAMSPVFNIDLFNRNIDNPTGYNMTRIRFEQIKEKQTVYGVELVKGDFLIAMMDGHATNLNKAFLYVFIQDTQIRIKGTVNLFDYTPPIVGGRYTGEMIDIPIEMNLKATIAAMFDDLLKVISPAEEASEGNGATTKMADALDPMTLLRGINVALLPTNHTKISLDLNTTVLNTFLTTTLNELFKTLAIDIPGADFSKVNYSQTSANTFTNTLWDNVILPYVAATANMSSSLINLVAGALKNQLLGHIRRLLPLPNSTEGTVIINIVQNKFAGIEINLRDNNHANKIFMDIDINDASAEGVLDWNVNVGEEIKNGNNTVHYKLLNGGYQPIDINFDPLANKQLKDYFGTYARKMISGKYAYERIVWDFATAGLDINAPVVGDYTVIGTAFGTNLSVKVKVAPTSEVVSINPVKGYQYGKTQDYVIVNFADGSSRIVYDVKVLSTPTTYNAHTVEGFVNLAGVDYPVDVVYPDCQIINLMGGNQYIFTAYDYGNSNIALPINISVKYAYGAHASVLARYDYSNLVDVTLAGGEYIVTMTIGNGEGLAQTFELKVIITGREVDQVLTNSVTANRHTIDPYEYSRLGELAQQTLYSNMVDVYYMDGSNETLEVVWDSSAVVYSYEGGSYKATIKYATANTQIAWTETIDVIVERRVAMNITVGGEDIITINPFVYADMGASYYFKDTAMVVFEYGKPVEMAVTWALGALTVNSDGGYYQVRATIGSDKLTQTIDYPVLVKPGNPTGISLGTNNRYTIDPAQVLYNNKKAFSDTLNVVFEGGRVEEMRATWNTENVKINMAGGTYKAVVTVAGRSFEIDVEVVHVADFALVDATLSINPYEYLQSNGSGFYDDNVTFSQDGAELKLPVIWTTNNVIISFAGGSYTAYLTLGSGTTMASYPVTVNVSAMIATSVDIEETLNTVTASSIEQLPNRVWINFQDAAAQNLEVVWLVSNVDFTQAGEYQVYAVIGGDIVALRQEIQVTLTVPEIKA